MSETDTGRITLKEANRRKINELENQLEEYERKINRLESTLEMLESELGASTTPYTEDEG